MSMRKTGPRQYYRIVRWNTFKLFPMESKMVLHVLQTVSSQGRQAVSLSFKAGLEGRAGLNIVLAM